MINGNAVTDRTAVYVVYDLARYKKRKFNTNILRKCGKLVPAMFGMFKTPMCKKSKKVT